MINQINDLYQGLFPDKVVPNIGLIMKQATP